MRTIGTKLTSRLFDHDRLCGAVAPPSGRRDEALSKESFEGLFSAAGGNVPQTCACVTVKEKQCREGGREGESSLLSLSARRGCCCLTHDRNKTMFSEAGEHQEALKQKKASRIREREREKEVDARGR